MHITCMRKCINWSINIISKTDTPNSNKLSWTSRWSINIGALSSNPSDKFLITVAPYTIRRGIGLANCSYMAKLRKNEVFIFVAVSGRAIAMSTGYDRVQRFEACQLKAVPDWFANNDSYLIQHLQYEFLTRRRWRLSRSSL